MSKKAGDVPNGSLDSLLAAMPRIAEAVKAFPEGLQAQAFEALMAEARGSTTPGKSAAAGSSSPKASPQRRSSKDSLPKGRRRASGPTTVKELDLHPKGKESLKEFAEKKKPKSNHDRNVVSVYYLLEIAGVGPVTANHVFTCYKDMGWREPRNLPNSLALTANRKRYLDTSNLDDIRLIPPGRNHVQLDLPAKKKSA